MTTGAHQTTPRVPIRVVLYDDNRDLRDMFRLLVDAQQDMVCVAAVSYTHLTLPTSDLV